MIFTKSTYRMQIFLISKSTADCSLFDAKSIRFVRRHICIHDKVGAFHSFEATRRAFDAHVEYTNAREDEDTVSLMLI